MNMGHFSLYSRLKCQIPGKFFTYKSQTTLMKITLGLCLHINRFDVYVTPPTLFVKQSRVIAVIMGGSGMSILLRLELKIFIFRFDLEVSKEEYSSN